MAKKIITGNPYTHEEHCRESVNAKSLGVSQDVMNCSWCGQNRKTLYIYDGRKGEFCSRDCFNNYHN